MGRLEKRQAYAASTSVAGAMLLLLATVLTVTEIGGGLALGVGACGGGMLLLGITMNTHVANEMMHDGRR
jgi:hypothetical protein